MTYFKLWRVEVMELLSDRYNSNMGFMTTQDLAEMLAAFRSDVSPPDYVEQLAEKYNLDKFYQANGW